MQPVLGVSHWQAFLAHITKHYKPTFLAAFNPPSHVLSCVGKCNGEPCSHGFEVDFCSPAAAAKLEHLHVDHEQDVLVTCDMWRAALPKDFASWNDGIDSALLCHLLFGIISHPIHGPPMLYFRCGPSSFGSAAGYCHQLNMPHYKGLRDVRSSPCEC